MAMVNAKMKKVHKTAMECIKYMVIKKGVSINQAEEMVMTTLKESEHYLRNGLIDETIASLRMIHMDETPEQAATKLIKSLLK